MFWLLKKIVRLKFATTSRAVADQLIRDELEKTLSLAEKFGPELAAKSARVPAMRGIDEDMREWNFNQILEHNAIVNRRIAETVKFLAENGPIPDTNFDPKTDVMPQPEAGPEQLEDFEKSVSDYLAVSEGIENLKTSGVKPHPLFGPFDAHKWHCMFGFHLGLHRGQAEALLKILKETNEA